MFVYKKLKGSDIALVPFNTHKQFSFTWGGDYDDPNASNFFMGTDSGSGCRIYTASYTQSNIDTWTSGNIQHSQLQHLYYGNYPFNVATTFGEVDIQNQYRNLDKKAVIISIPQQYYGSQIKPGSFSYSRNLVTNTLDGLDLSNLTTCFDDGKGNLIEFTTLADALYQDGVTEADVFQEDKGTINISEQNPFSSKFLIEGNHPNASIDLSRLTDPKNRLLSIYPRNAYKKTRLELDKHGNPLVNLPFIGITAENGDTQSIYKSLTGLYPISDDWNMDRALFDYTGPGSSRYVPRLYNEEFVYDDSYYRNLLTYKNIWFADSLIEDNTNNSILEHNIQGYCAGKFEATVMNFVAKHNNNTTGSMIISPHNEKFNFNLEDDFSITFHVRMPDYQVSATTFEGPFDRQYIIGKSTTKTTVGPPQETRAGGVINLSQTGSASEITASAAPQFPFEIFVEGIPGGMVLPLGASGDGTIPNPTYKFVFAMSDGVNTVTASCTPLGNGAGEWQHITAVYEGVHSGSEGRLSITTTGIQGISENHKDFPGLLVTSSFTNSHPDNNRNLPILKNPLQNNANIYIGCKGEKAFENKNNESGSFFEGVLYGINIWDYALHPSESKALAHMFTYDATKYVGNIFYNQGIAVITNPVFLKEGTASFDNGGKACPSFAQTGSATSSVVFQGTHVIYENEYQCTVQENEMNFSTNITTRKIQSEDGQEIADFTTSSLFQPYVTTIGLYNEENELLVVGKLGQPVRTSQETDTTFVLRWDT